MTWSTSWKRTDASRECLLGGDPFSQGNFSSRYAGSRPVPEIPIRATRLSRFYEQLYGAYGPQGWWPLLGHPGTHPGKTGAIAGYHPGDYSFPRTGQEQFEIYCGAILTQNTAWTHVEKTLKILDGADALDPRAILSLPPEALAALIRSSGYHNAKARKLKELAAFFQDLRGRVPAREELLAVWGVGPETADSLRLYAHGQLEMVVDAYTRRILARLAFVPESVSYEELKQHCVQNLPAEVTVYQEFHALLVEHAKRIRASKAEDWSRPIPA